MLRPGWAWRGETAGDGEPGSGSSSGSAGTASAALLQEHCRGAAGLTPFKLPRRVAALRELPRNSSGKVLKAAVRELLLAARPPRSAL